MRNNNPQKTATAFDSKRVLSSLGMALSFWKPIAANEIPSNEQLEKDRRETHLAIESSDRAIQQSKDFLTILQGQYTTQESPAPSNQKSVSS